MQNPFIENNEPAEKEIQEIKNHLEKSHGREFTWEEATKAAWDMRNLAQLFLKAGTEEYERQKKLKEFPKGFHLEGRSYTCSICNEINPGESSWYDKYGIKCMTCQKAINLKIIPRSVAKNKEQWYSKYELEDFFNLKGALLNKYIKQGFLKVRIIPGESKKNHHRLFLIKDNRDVLPPKKLLRARTVKVMKNGEEFYTSEDWYEYIDIPLAKKISKYRIVECLKETFQMPIEKGHFYHKEINPLFRHKS
ncbi:MAG: hypothetical protein JSR71_06615 [Proteobacteria bacterium]|nr:hypothetical protein [Pseudomonadota bacterium]